jgi:hypothetical protein
MLSLVEIGKRDVGPGVRVADAGERRRTDVSPRPRSASQSISLVDPDPNRKQRVVRRPRGLGGRLHKVLLE